jgi:DNA-binding NtrC family response regulator
MKKMLVIDNSQSVRESLRIIFQNAFQVTATDPWQDVLALIREEQFDLVIIGIDGRVGQEIDLLRDITSFNPQLPLLALIEQGQRESLEGLSSSYVTDLMTKPFNVFELREKVKRIQQRGSVSPYVRSPFKMKHIFQQQKIYFSSSVRHRLSEVSLRSRATALFPVLLQGEKGTGREIAAKWLHFRSPHLDRLFCRLNAASLMEEALLNVFLVKEKGFYKPKNLGTLYLEEVGNLRLDVQERLTELLDEGCVATPDGKEIAVNFRVVASTSRDLPELVYRHAFKEELYYKLSVINIQLPPLRERQEEIGGIARQVLEGAAQKYALRVKGFSPDALNLLKNYYWPGNVQELESVVLRTLIFSSQEMITERDLRFGPEERSGEAEEYEKEPEPEVKPAEVKTTEAKAPAEKRPEEKKPGDKKPVMEVIRTERKPADKPAAPPLAAPGEDAFKELVAELAHEIKNPLVAIKTFTQLLAERFDDKEFREQFYRTAGENIDRINQLVEKIMGSARFSRPVFAQVNLHALLEQLVAKTGDSFTRRRIVCRKTFKENLPPVMTDEEQLAYSIDNILSALGNLAPAESEILLATRTASVDPGEKVRYPQEHLPNGFVAELSISYPDAAEKKQTSPYHSIELFLARQIIGKNLGVMEIVPAEGTSAVVVKLPVAAGGKS